MGDVETFVNSPVDGAPDRFAGGRPEHVDRAARAAEAAFASYSTLSRASRAAFLRAIADEIDVRGEAITAIGTRETGLPPERLEAERGRTVGQLGQFADHIEAGDYLDRRHDPALPDSKPLPRPDLPAGPGAA